MASSSSGWRWTLAFVYRAILHLDASPGMVTGERVQQKTLLSPSRFGTVRAPCCTKHPTSGPPGRQ